MFEALKATVFFPRSRGLRFRVDFHESHQAYACVFPNKQPPQDGGSEAGYDKRVKLWDPRVQAPFLLSRWGLEIEWIFCTFKPKRHCQRLKRFQLKPHGIC